MPVAAHCVALSEHHARSPGRARHAALPLLPQLALVEASKRILLLLSRQFMGNIHHFDVVLAVRCEVRFS